MHGEIAGSGGHLEGAIGAPVHRIEPASRLDAEPARRNDLGNAIVAGVDHAADRLRAVPQRRRAAHHLDAICRERIDGNSVVLAQRGDIVRADAVLLHAHTIVVQAADDGPVGAGREVRACDARPILERVGQVGPRRAGDLVRRHHRERHEGVFDDDPRVAAGGVFGSAGAAAAGASPLRGGSDDRARRGHDDARQLSLRSNLVAHTAAIAVARKQPEQRLSHKREELITAPTHICYL